MDDGTFRLHCNVVRRLVDFILKSLTFRREKSRRKIKQSIKLEFVVISKTYVYD